MKKYSQFLESMSVLLIFILLLQLTACYSTRVISAADLVFPYSEKFSYVIQTPNSKYVLDNAAISSDTLSGRINKIVSAVRGNKVRLYLSADSLLKVNTDRLVKISFDDIDKVEKVKLSTGKTIVLGIVCIPVFIYLGMLIDFAINGIALNLSLGG